MENQAGNPGFLEQEILDAPGSSSLPHLRSLIESKVIQSRIPDPLLLSPGTVGRDGELSPDLRISTRAEDSSWANIYSTRGSLIRVNLDRLKDGQANAFWYNPCNGKWCYRQSDTDEKTPFLTVIVCGQNTTLKDTSESSKSHPYRHER